MLQFISEVVAHETSSHSIQCVENISPI